MLLIEERTLLAGQLVVISNKQTFECVFFDLWIYFASTLIFVGSSSMLGASR